MIPKKWANRVNEIIDMMKQGMTTSQMAEYFGVKPSAMRMAISRLRKEGLLPSREEILYGEQIVKVPENRQQKLTVKFPDKKESKFDYRQFLQKAIEMQELLREKSINQKEATVEIVTNKPIAIAFTSDWHLGDKGTDYRALLRHFDLFLSVPNLFIGLLGDYGNFFVKSKMKSAMLSQLFGPQEQFDVLEGMFKEIGHKVLFRTTGNHDDFLKDETGIDIAARFFEGCSHAPYLREGGGVNVKVGCDDEFATYRIYVKHKYRFHSSLNPTNSHKRMHDLESPFDIGVLGHRHIPEVLHTDRWSGAVKKEMICLLTGTYKVDDTWARAEGFGQSSNIGCPTVILFPKEKRMIPFKYVEDAVMVLKLIDEVWNSDPGKVMNLVENLAKVS